MKEKALLLGYFASSTDVSRHVFITDIPVTTAVIV